MINFKWFVVQTLLLSLDFLIHDKSSARIILTAGIFMYQKVSMSVLNLKIIFSINIKYSCIKIKVILK